MNGHGSDFFERAVQVLGRLVHRDRVMLFVAMMILALMAMLIFAVTIGGPLPSSVPVLSADQHRSDAEKRQHDDCKAYEGEGTSADRDADKPESASEKRREQHLALCLSGVTVRESLTANDVAAEYNRISADAANWAKVANVLVIVLGLVSVIGIIVAVFAASDARRALDLGELSVAATRRSSRAYLRITDGDLGYRPSRILNAGTSPAFITGLRVAHPPADLGDLDPSVLEWTEHQVPTNLLAAGAQADVILPVGKERRPHGTLVGVIYIDVHEGRWLSWRHCSFDEESGLLRLGRAGEFPYW